MITSEDKAKLNKPFPIGEIQQELKTLGNFKEPSPDGFYALFFKQIWDHLG